MAKAVGFTESAARRIGNAVRTVERGSRDQSAIRFRQPGDDSSSVTILLGTITGTWTAGLLKDVEVAGEGYGTISARNWLVTLPGTGTRSVVIAYAQNIGEWILLNWQSELDSVVTSVLLGANSIDFGTSVVSRLDFPGDSIASIPVDECP